MTEPQSLVVHFGDCELDLAGFELRRGGQVCQVEPQVLEVLSYLVRNPNRLITKSDLIEHVWGGRIVSDSTLASRLKSARRAIGDDGEHQKLIRTVHGRGVRFVGEIRAEPGPETKPAAARNTTGGRMALDSARPAIAVLPFANIGGDPEQSYFVDGLTEDIITDLARFGHLRVVARSSCFRYREFGDDLQKVCRELGADYVVTGSVRRRGSQLRLSAQLMAADSPNQLWAERFDRNTEDVFVVADELVGTIAATLAGRVRSAGSARVKRKPPANLVAYESVLRAQAALVAIDDDHEKDDVRRLFEQALISDPDYPRAHAGLAIVLVRDWYRDSKVGQAALDLALDHAQRAVALDSHDNECQETLGWVLLQRRQFDLAEQHYRRAIELNPHSPDELASMGSACSYLGRPSEGIGWFELAKRTDPYFDPPWYWNLLGVTYFNARRYDDALEAFSDCTSPPAWVRAYMAATHALAGRVEEAHALAAKIAADAPGFSAGNLIRKEPYKNPADQQHLIDGLRKAGFVVEIAHAPANAHSIAGETARDWRPPYTETETLEDCGTASNEAHRYYLMGRSFFINGGWGKRALEVARQLFVKAIEFDPDYARAYAALANCDCHRLVLEIPDVSFQTIAENSERALALEPGLAEAYTAKAMAHVAAGAYAEADAAFGRALSLGPDSFDTHFFYGRHCMTQSRNEDAAKHFERAAALNPQDYGALGLLVDCYENLGRHDDAMRAAARCVKRVETEVAAHPDNASAYAFGAIVASEVGRQDLAADWAARALAIDPDDLVVNYNLACVYAALGNLDFAMSRLARAIPADPVSRRAWAEWMKIDISIDVLRPLPEFQRLAHGVDPEIFPDPSESAPLQQRA